VIHVSEEAKMLLGNLWAPDGEVLRLIPSPEADGSAELAFRYGRGEGADQIVQHDGRRVLRIAPSVRKDFDRLDRGGSGWGSRDAAAGPLLQTTAPEARPTVPSGS
jgi:hypothetical protein